MSTVKANTFQDASGGSTATINGMTPTADSLQGFRNRLINGGMAVDQRNAGASQTITAAAALAYTVDRWYAYCTGANVTGQQVAGSGINQYRYRFSGAASVTKIGFAQRIEQLNCYDLNGTTATLSVDLANSLLTTVTWTAWYANTANTFGTLASPTRTQIATGTFTVNSTVTRYSTNISIPAAATTGIEIELSVGAQTSGTWTIGNVQLEAGSVATPFERRSYGTELALCQRYFETSYASGTAPGAATSTNAVYSASTSGVRTGWHIPFFVVKRASPTTTVWDFAGTAGRTTQCDPTTGARTNGANNIATNSGGTTAIELEIGVTSGSYYGCHWASSAEI